nr:non-ribosomal peptide synthase [Catenulispora sp.]
MSVNGFTADGPGAYRRPLSATDWWFAAHPRSLSPVIQTVIEGEGTLDLEELAAAVARAAEAHPGTRLRRRGRVWIAGDAPPPVRRVDGVTAGLAAPRIAALHDPLPTADGSHCEVLWCPGSARSPDSPGSPGSPTVLVFRASHAVMDGRGKAMWVADVFRALRGEAPLGAADQVTDADVYAKLGITNAETKPDVWYRPPLPDPGWTPGPRTAWTRRTIDGYHLGLTAKVASALTGVYGLDTAKFAIAFDLRRHLPGVRTTGNMVQTELFEVSAGAPWQDLHERLLATMAEGREISWRLDPNLLKMPMFALRAIIRVMEGRNKDRRAAVSVLSHLGRVEDAELCAPSFEARSTYVLPLLSAMSAPELNVVEFGGRTEITLSWRTGTAAEDRASEVLDALVEQLSPAAAESSAQALTTAPRPAAPGVVERFRAAVARDPAATALRWPDGEMSFAELDARSEAVAARLVELGQGRGAVVGVLAERTAAAIAAIWGVLKAGAAYLPLDPEHPEARLAALLSDAGAAVCLLPGAGGGPVWLPDGCAALWMDGLPASAPRVAVTPASGDLAYLIYTSGSTGTPKGVEVEHAQLASYVDWATERFSVEDSTSFAVFSSLAYDLPHTALYLSTLAGAPLVLVPDRPSHLSLRHLVEESGANALKLTPSHLDLMARLDLSPQGFRTLVVGGEPLPAAVAARAAEQFGPDCAIHNHYGPTEATVGCVVHDIRPTDVDDQAVVPIGRPAPGCTVRLLDADRRPVPSGEPGEMYVGGAQLARGYRGRPDLTRERFVRLADGTRAYRSGDLAKLLPSGEIAFLGRADDQAKVAGHRVEPGEVAHALQEHPGVRRAVVIVRRTSQGESVLCGYAAAEPGVSAEELIGYLAERLPRHMVPAVIRLVEEFAATPNGKIDLGALPDPFEEGPGSKDRPVSEKGPHSENPDEVATAIAAIWADVLGVDAAQLDAASDFHRLGGASVLLLAMLARVGTDVVGPVGERALVSGLGEIIGSPTLGTVSALARKALSDSTVPMDSGTAMQG